MGRKGGSGLGGGGGKPTERSLELYRRFVEGNSMYIHEEATEAEKRELDKLFSPAQQDMQVYKGMIVYDDDLSLDGMKKQIESYSSTSVSRTTAMDYANRAFDLQAAYDDGIKGVIDKPVSPVMMKMTIKKGTPIVDALKTLGSSGMKPFEKEITVGRKAKYSYSNFRRVGDYYWVDVTVRGG